MPFLEEVLPLQKPKWYCHLQKFFFVFSSESSRIMVFHQILLFFQKYPFVFNSHVIGKNDEV